MPIIEMSETLSCPHKTANKQCVELENALKQIECLKKENKELKIINASLDAEIDSLCLE